MSDYAAYQAATLDEILLSRDRRAERQQQLLSCFGLPVVTLSLNIPGAVKQFPLARKTYLEARSLMLRQFERHSIQVASSWEEAGISGSAGCFAVCAQAEHVKKLLMAIEETLPLARLFDMDVMDSSGQSISRRDFGYPPRRCLLCSEPAAVCARAGTHAREELFRHAHALMAGHFHARAADDIASMALRSLLFEVCVSPKPGLVDRNNNGAHHDMDMFTFLQSASVLVPCFRDAVRLGLSSAGDAPQTLFPKLRYLGMTAEDAMLAATCGVNTHKGAIFLFTILCAATGRVLSLDRKAETDSICRMAAAIAADLAEECRDIRSRNSSQTNGEELIRKNNILGIRGEVLGGFQSVRTYSLPVLTDMLNRGFSPDQAGSVALLALIANVTDTNVIKRSSLERSRELRQLCAGILEQQRLPDEKVLLELDTMMTAENISPGGCADLLGVTFFFYFLASYMEKTADSA